MDEIRALQKALFDAQQGAVVNKCGGAGGGYGLVGGGLGV
jgi:hypothetical protein